MKWFLLLGTVVLFFPAITARQVSADEFGADEFGRGEGALSTTRLVVSQQPALPPTEQPSRDDVERPPVGAEPDPDSSIGPLGGRTTPGSRFDRQRDPFSDLDSSTRRYRSRPPTRLASVPNMFGDFYGTGGNVLIDAPPEVFRQTWTDTGPVPFRVFNTRGGPGATNDPNTGIIARTFDGQILTMSIGPGEDNSGDEFMDTFEISEPLGSRPAVAGQVRYLGGKAVYFGPAGLMDPEDPQQANGTSDQHWALLFEHLVDPGPVVLALAGGGSAAVRRVRLSENNSPEPRDRVVFNYSFFSDVVGNLGDVNRYIFGFEKTFFDRDASIEVRLPFAATLSSNQVFGAPQLRDTEWGNAALIYKHILTRTTNGLISVGTGVTLPTADDARVTLLDGRPILVLNNESVHFLPFAAHIYRSGNLFLQSFAQLDIDANGNPVATDFTGHQLVNLGTLQDSTLLFLDLGAGYTTFSDPQSSGITRITPMAELHYVSPLQDADAASDGTITVTSLQNRYDMLNATFGVDFQCREHIHVRPGLTVPLRSNDREFDYEVQLQINSFF